jgi:pilus assembly protein CpaC
MKSRFVHRALAVLCLLACTASASAGEDGDQKVVLGVGTQKVIKVAEIARVAIGDPSVADVKPLGSSQILVVGLAEGRTTLLVWNSKGSRLSYLVSVQKQDPEGVLQDIRTLLGDRKGVSVRMVGDRIYLEGLTDTSEDQERVDRILGLYPQVKSFVKPSPNARKLTANSLNAALQRAGMKNVQVSVTGSTLFLEGSVESQQDLQRAELIIKALGEQVENLLVVGIKRMILVEVQFVEVRRDSEDRIGLKLPVDLVGSTAGSVSVLKQLSPSAHPTSNASLNLNASGDFAFQLRLDDGYGRLLAQPKLVCASGEKAEFLAGGEVPVPLVTNNSFSVEFKPFGVKLGVRPTADNQGNIQTEIEAEDSAVDHSVAVTTGPNVSVPGFRTRRVKTSVTVRNGDTIVMSGISENDEQKSVSKFPLLGHIPVVGELFKNRVTIDAKRELVIFVTPRLVSPEAERNRKMVEEVSTHYRQARDDVSPGLFD